MVRAGAAGYPAAVLRAAIFDMDGLLIDSEPIWRRSEVQAFGEVGLELTEELCEATTGLRIDEVVAHWHGRSPWAEPSCEDVARRIEDLVVERVRAEGAPLAGVAQALDACASAGLKLAVASSSSERLIEATLERLGLAERFAIVVSAQRERLGKPHPAVFLTTAAALGVQPTECVIFEDSVPGALAAKAARARCVAVPSAAQRRDPRFGIADRVLGSLRQVDVALLRALGEDPPRLGSTAGARHVLTILAAQDIEPVVEFYRRAFGWSVAVQAPVYVELSLPDGQRIGVHEREAFARNTGRLPKRIAAEEITPAELYLHVDDLRSAVDRLRQMGARELSPPELRPWGDEAAYFADPIGTVVVVASRHTQA